jgi:glutathione S-transferase
MYRLHYAPDNASLVVRLALEELGVPYRTALVDRAARAQEGAAYRALAPTGLIPVLETPDGPLFETGAILLWLADRHGGLAPAPGDAARGDFLKWLFFISNTLHADMRGLFHPERHAGADPAGFRALTEARILRALGLLDAALAERPAWCRPGAPGAMGCYLGPLLRWLALYPRAEPMAPDLAGFPALLALLSNMESRPSTRRAAEAEGLGATPFTAPAYPSPPKGSAT